MARAKFLTDAEKAVISQLHQLDLSNCEIARRIARSEKVVRNFLKKGAEYGQKKESKRNTKICNRDRIKLIELASTGRYKAREIVNILDLPIGKRQVCNILKGTRHFKYCKKMTQPALKPEHEAARLQWSKKYMDWTTEWTNVIFTDEKKFNLDGPDGFAYYWHDLRKEKQFRFSRNFGGGSIMVWAGFSMRGKTPIAKITTRMNSKKYIEMLEDILIPYSEDVMDGDFVFQQDNAAIHVSRLSRAWFEEKNIELLDWPARSPDLNPIENLWGIMARQVYDGGRQFSTVQELEVAIKNTWREINVKTLETLVNSMPDRVFNVIHRHGKQLNN